MMKKGIYSILTALTVFALVMTGCDTGSSPKKGQTPPPDGSSTTLNFIQIGGNKQEQPTSTNRNPDPSKIPELLVLKISASASQNQEVILSWTGTDARKAAVAKNSYAEADFQPYNAASKPKFSFTDNDKLYVKMTSGDGKSVMYYGFTFEIGTDTSLKEFVFYFEQTIGTQTAKSVTAVENFGTSSDVSFTAITEPGKIQFSVKQPADGFLVEASANDPDATIKIYKDAGTTEIVADTDKTVFADSDSVYVLVTAGNGRTKGYYKIDITLRRAINIPYGTPTTINAETIDEIWSNVDPTTGQGATNWVYINRSNPTEGSGYLDLPEADRSFGRAKLMWDEDGVWVYAEVWERTVSSSAGDHTKSSIELFLNEAYPTVTTGNVTDPNNGKGGQYRLGANGELTGSPTTPAVDAFKALGKTSAVKFENITPPADYPQANRPNNNITSGYKLLFQAPWLYTATYPLAGEKQLSIELQINATKSDGTRAGVLNWNNISSSSYSSLADYGDAVLKLNGNTMKPQKPNITTQPAVTTKVNVGATSIPALTVAAASLDGGDLSYKWYQATSATAAGVVISGATLPSYTPTVSTTEEADFFFYVEVINTKGTASNSRLSSRAKVSVVNPDAQIYTLELVKSDNAKWDATEKALLFTPTEQYEDLVTFALGGADVSNYARIEVVVDAWYPNPAFDPNETDPDKIVPATLKAPYSQYGNVIVAVIASDNFGWNSSGALTGKGYFYTLGTAHANGTDILLKVKYGGNGNPYPVNKVVIRSVRLVAKDPAVFQLDLSKEVPSADWNPTGSPPGTGTGTRLAATKATTNEIEWTFTSAGSQRVAIYLTDEQAAKLANEDIPLIDVTITGTNSGNAGNYQYYFGTVTTQQDWNGTAGEPSGLWSTLGSTAGVTRTTAKNGNATKDPPSRLTSFILRNTNTLTTNETVNITSIKVELIKQ